jgi:REP element-mobilizing transposase RayT
MLGGDNRMPRQAREKCESGIYHIILRGINRQSIFHDDADYQKFLDIVDRIKGPDRFMIYGFCLMGNHVHLLLHELKDKTATIMKRVGVSYAKWYNKKYDRVGHVFQDRYKSEAVEDDGYLINLLRYIHCNPVKAGIVVEPQEYKWSSCREYLKESGYSKKVTNTAFILGTLSENEEIGKKMYEELMQQEINDQFLDIDGIVKKTDADLYEEIQKILNGRSVSELHKMDKKTRDEILRCIKKVKGITQRQISRVTGINQSMVFKA